MTTLEDMEGTQQHGVGPEDVQECVGGTDLGQDHGGDLLGRELVGGAKVLDLNLGVAFIVDDLEGPRLHVLLDSRVIEAAANETPSEVERLALANQASWNGVGATRRLA